MMKLRLKPIHVAVKTWQDTHTHRKLGTEATVHRIRSYNTTTRSLWRQVSIAFYLPHQDLVTPEKLM